MLRWFLGMLMFLCGLTLLPAWMSPATTMLQYPTPFPTPEMVLRPGASMRVQLAEGTWLNLRAGPGTNYAVRMLLKDGTHLTILDGPVEAEGFRWWQVRTDKGKEGWVVDVIDGLQTLVP